MVNHSLKGVLHHITPQWSSVETLHNLILREQLLDLLTAHKMDSDILARLGLLLGNELNTDSQEGVDKIGVVGWVG